MVLILGDVGEMREIAEGADDAQRLIVVEAVERRLQFAAGANLVIPVETDRGLADALQEFVDLAALLFAHRVAEKATEQADIGAQRRVLLRFGEVAPRGAVFHNGDRHGRSLERPDAPAPTKVHLCCSASKRGASELRLIS